jgi:hypothetical protein
LCDVKLSNYKLFFNIQPKVIDRELAGASIKTKEIIAKRYGANMTVKGGVSLTGCNKLPFSVTPGCFL